MYIKIKIHPNDIKQTKNELKIGLSNLGVHGRIWDPCHKTSLFLRFFKNPLCLFVNKLILKKILTFLFLARLVVTSLICKPLLKKIKSKFNKH